MKPERIDWVALIASVVLLLPSAAFGHGLDPIGVSIREAAGGEVSVVIDRPSALVSATGVEVTLEPACEELGHAIEPSAAGRVREDRRLRCSGGLEGTALAVRGLEMAGLDAVVRLELAGGRVHRGVLTPAAASLRLTDERTVVTTATSYLLLGAKHLALGWDHLLFVLGVAVLARETRRAALALTAFTIGHSATLSAAAVGYLRFPTAWAEIGIALSLVWLALDVLRDRHTQRSAGRLALVSGALGLVHGLGFATALSQAGLPEGDIPLALGCFNVGIELAQLAFVLMLFGAAHLARRAAVDGERARPWLGHALGAVAAMWLIERVWLL